MDAPELQSQPPSLLRAGRVSVRVRDRFSLSRAGRLQRPCPCKLMGICFRGDPSPSPR